MTSEVNDPAVTESSARPASIHKPEKAATEGRVEHPRRPLGARVGTWVAVGLLLAGALTMILPFIWTVSTSLKTDQTVREIPPQLVPDPATLDSYRELNEELPFWRILAN